MKQIVIVSLAIITMYAQVTAQDTVRITLPDTIVHATAASLSLYRSPRMDNTSVASKPYHISFKTDGPIIGGGIALTAFGTYLISQKHDLTPAQLASKTRDNVPFFDRGNVGYYSEKADRDSYIPFKISFGWPVLLALINNNERHNAFPILTLYVETMAVTGTFFTMATGTVYRSRPYVYNTTLDVSRRIDKDSQRAFYAGHTAATAAATFFAAKVFQDLNPESPWRYVVWGLGAATPALVGYLRYKAGMHFLSDNVLGYAMGAAAGILIPKWHENKRMKNVSIVPEVGTDSKGMAVIYKF